MATYSVGQRVTNTNVLGSKKLFSLGADIQPGSTGRVIDVEDKPLGGTSYLVRFDDGNESWAQEDELVRI